MGKIEVNVPSKCPACGRLSAENDRHCKGANWAKCCLVIICTRCGCLYSKRHNSGAQRKWK